MVLVERIEPSSQHLLFESDRMLLVSSGRTLHLREVVSFLIYPELLTQFVDDGMVESAFLSFLYFFASG